MASNQELILYLYTFSPYVRKITTYLALRGIPYTECHQPIIMPRPDLAALGVKYRRIPVLSIGRDLYCDSALILEKLEHFYPGSQLGGKTGTDKALIKLLQKWTDLDVFARACESIPPDMAALSDPAFLKDREELWGREWSKAKQERMRAEALQAMRHNFDLLETMMADGERKWVLESDGPSLADINAMWIFDWLFEMIQGGLPEETFSAKTYPKTFAWRERYREAYAAAKAKLGTRPVIDGHEAAKRIFASQFHEQDLAVDEHDFTGVKKGAEVAVWAIDDHSGRNTHQVGQVVGLTAQETVVENETQNGETRVRVHLPRWNYRVEPADAKNGVGNHHHPGHQHGGDDGLGAEHYEERH